MKILKECEWTVQCENCGDYEVVTTLDASYVMTVNFSAPRHFRKQGWRDYCGMTMCPECYKEAKNG